MGLSFDHSLHVLYSIGEDGKFKMTDTNLSTIIFETSPGKNSLKAMVHNKERGIFCIGDGEGNIFIYVIGNPPELVAAV